VDPLEADKRVLIIFSCVVIGLVYILEKKKIVDKDYFDI